MSIYRWGEKKISCVAAVANDASNNRCSQSAIAARGSLITGNWHICGDVMSKVCSLDFGQLSLCCS